MKKRILGTVLAIMLLLTACTGEEKLASTPEYAVESAEEEPTENPDKNTPTEKPAKTSKLNISIFQNQDIELLVRKFADAHPEVDVITTVYDWTNDRAKYLEQLPVKIMSGTAEDIFDSYEVYYNQYADRGLLADFNELMDNDPSFDKSQYYTNAFDAVKYNGGIYALPLSFMLEFVSINKFVSEEDIARFKQLDRIGFLEQVDFFKSVRDKYNLEFSTDYRPENALIVNSWRKISV